MNSLTYRLALLCLLLPIGLLAGCNKSPGAPVVGGLPAASATTTDIVFTGSTMAQLFAFEAKLQELRLERLDGTLTENLITGDVQLELLHLQARAAWLARYDVPAGDYAAVVARFVPDSYRATTTAGSAVSVMAISDELRAEFIVPLAVAGEPYMRFEVELDLVGSLTGIIADGLLSLDPTGSADSSDGVVPRVLDGRLARVRDREPGTGELLLDVYADQELNVLIGQVTANVMSDALLVTQLNFVETHLPFYFTYLTPGAAIVDLQTRLGGNGRLEVTCVELEDQNGTVTSPRFPLKVEGRVVEVTSPFVFKIRVRSIRRGESLVGPITGAPIVDVIIDPQTGLFFDGLSLMPASNLVVGLDVALKSEQLTLDPMFATRIAVAERVPAFTGTVTDVSGLPQTFVMRLDVGAPAIIAGQVESELTDVLVQTSSAPFLLATSIGHPITPADVVVGLTMDVAGSISGPATVPIVQATRLELLPGRLAGATASFSANTDFNADGGVIVDAFGPNLVQGGGGLFQVELQPGAVFRGAATSAAELQVLIAGPSPVLVEVLGLESPLPGRIRGFEVISQ